MITHPAIDLLSRLLGFRTETSEAAQAAFLSEVLTSWGAAVRTQEVLPGRVNVTATWPGRDPSRVVLFEAHGDIVPGGPAARLDSAAGRYYGRGACDNKGPMAAVLVGIHRALDAGRPPVTVCFASTCREETGGEGARALAASVPRPSLAVIAEPTQLSIVRAHKGAYRTRITTTGVAAHSSDPARGRNAICAMRPVLAAIEEEFAPALAARPDSLLGAPTVSVGTIRGGVAANIVPDTCAIEVDWRLVPGQTGDDVLAQLRARFPAALIEPYEYYPPFHQPADAPCVRAVAAACAHALGRPPTVLGVPWAANAGVLQALADWPCVIFGPGDIAQAHTADEFVDVQQVIAAVDVYRQIILEATECA
jgi:acetylornithine deacetylase/succinyl-diaminopimelate desuccinylase-like protein